MTILQWLSSRVLEATETFFFLFDTEFKETTRILKNLKFKN